MKGTISKQTTVIAVKHQVSCELGGGEAAILNLENGMYYGLNPIGVRVGNLIREPKTVNEVCDTLLKDYDVESERCEHDVVALLHKLLEEGLIEVKDETSA